jgi:hypothetical protein
VRIIPPNHTPESYPESYPRIIPQKITIMNVSFGIAWDCIGLTSFNGPDKLIDQCWPDPMIPGYLNIPWYTYIMVSTCFQHFQTILFGTIFPHVWGPPFLLLPRHLVRSHDLALARSGAAPLFARAVPWTSRCLRWGPGSLVEGFAGSPQVQLAALT